MHSVRRHSHHSLLARHSYQRASISVGETLTILSLSIAELPSTRRRFIKLLIGGELWRSKVVVFKN